MLIVAPFVMVIPWIAFEGLTFLALLALAFVLVIQATRITPALPRAFASLAIALSTRFVTDAITRSRLIRAGRG